MMSNMEKKLRAVTIFSSVGAFAILVPATLFSSRHYPRWGYHKDSVIGFCFIPLFFTIGTSAIHVHLQQTRKDNDRPVPFPLLWSLGDLLIFAGYMIALVSEWTYGVGRLENAPGLAFLEAYTTVPLMVNMLVHLVIISLNAKTISTSILKKEWRKPAQCPHCHHQIGKKTSEVEQKGTGEGYSLLRGEDYDEDAARASEDVAEASADSATVGPIIDV